MAASSQRTISLGQLFQAANNHKLPGIVTLIAVFGMVVAVWVLLPRKYGSEGRLFVQIGRANLGLNNAPDDSRGISIQDTRETEILSVAELIKSYDLLGAVVDEIGSARILANSWMFPDIDGLRRRFTGGPASGDSLGEYSSAEYDRLRTRERAIELLEREIDVWSEKKTSVISVYCTAATPPLAQQVVDLVMEKAREKHVAIHSASRSRNFFDRELERQQEELASAEKALAEFRTGHKILSIEQARNILDGVIEKLENQRVDVDVDLDQSLARIGELSEQLRQVSKQLEMPTRGLQSESTEGAHIRLYERIGEKARLRAKYSSEHPKISEIDAEIEALQTEIAALPIVREESALVQNPVYEQLKVELALEESRARSLEGRRDEVETKYGGAMEELTRLNGLELQSAALQRAIDVASQEFSIYARKRGEARVVDQLDQHSISDVVIAQPASLVLKRQSPKGSVMLPIGFAFAGFAALFVTLLADRKNLSGLSTPEEVEEALQIPVLVSIPRVHSSRLPVH